MENIDPPLQSETVLEVTLVRNSRNIF